jgi:hypothetical protein
MRFQKMLGVHGVTIYHFCYVERRDKSDIVDDRDLSGG